MRPAILVLTLLLGTGSFTDQEQQITHLLNRIGFGPRPGDIELIKHIGIENYVDQQLHPERIDDSSTERRLSSFPSLRMSTRQLLEKYPAPQQIARLLGSMTEDNDDKRGL